MYPYNGPDQTLPKGLQGLSLVGKTSAGEATALMLKMESLATNYKGEEPLPSTLVWLSPQLLWAGWQGVWGCSVDYLGIEFLAPLVRMESTLCTGVLQGGLQEL